MERDVALDFLSELGGMAGAGPAGGALHGPLPGGPAAGLPASLAAPGVAGGGGQHRAGLGSLDAMAGPRGGGIGPHGGLGGGGLLDSAFGGGDVLTGSAFALNRRTRAGGIVSFWSRSAQSHFAGREGLLALDGAVRTTMVGADYARGALVAGLSLAHSRGLGGYDGVSAGRAASAVTGLYPWLGYQVSARVSVWGVTGYGAGGLLLTPAGGPALESALSMKMAAAGTRGELVGNGTAGFGLAFKADALWVGTAVDGVDGPAGRMTATEAAASRVRTALEGSRGYVLGGGLSLKPSVEVGLRHDGGDAEQGSGIDVGGGLVVFDPSSGLSVNVQVRMLLVHEAEGFSERGVSVSVSWNPTPSTPLGFVARVAPSWGGQAAGGAQALWGRETMADMAHGGFAQGDRLDGEVGYGLPVGRPFSSARRGSASRPRSTAATTGSATASACCTGTTCTSSSVSMRSGGRARSSGAAAQAGGPTSKSSGAPACAGRAPCSRSAVTGQGSLMNELPSVGLTQRFLALCEHHGSQRLAVRLVAVGRSTGVSGLPPGDDWTAWNAEEMRAAVEYLEQMRIR